jgi:hypothetical protein
MEIIWEVFWVPCVLKLHGLFRVFTVILNETWKSRVGGKIGEKFNKKG